MKFLYLIILISLIYHTNALDSKWSVVDSCQSDIDRYKEIACPDSENCILWNSKWSSHSFTFRRTTDGGLTWKDVYNNYNYELLDLAYPHKDLFLAVGDNMILRSTNQGDTWDTTKFVNLDINSIFRIFMFDKFTGFVISCTGDCDINTKILYFETKDGGLSWHEKQFSEVILLKDIVRFDSLTYFIYGSVKNAANKWKSYNIWTYDNWQTFDTIPPILQTGFSTFYDVNHAWSAGGYYDPNNLSKTTHRIIFSTDGLRTGEIQLDKKGNGCRILSIKFFDEYFGMATSCNALVYYTVNGGKTWYEDKIQDFDNSSPYDYALQSLQIPSKNVAYVLSSSNWVLKFNGDWTGVDDPHGEPLKDIPIAPNPASDYIDISVPRWRGQGVDICIFDLLGTEVLNNSQLSIFNSQLRIDVSHLAPGLYFIKLNNLVKKFIKI